MILHLAVATGALAIGIFAAASPAEAARIWGWKNLHQLDPEVKTLYFRCYRAFGVLLTLAGALFAFESSRFLR